MKERFTENDTSLDLWVDDPNDKRFDTIVNRIASFLRGIGFSIGPDKSVSTLIRKDRSRGAFKDLKVRIWRVGRHLEITFFQDIVTINKNGGEYDFDKFRLMPYLIRKRYELVRNKLGDFITRKGFPPLTLNPPKLFGMAYIERQRKELEDFQGADFYKNPVAKYNAETREGFLLHDGAEVAFLDIDLRWRVGTAFHHINNMWWVLFGSSVWNISVYDLFSIPFIKGQGWLKHGRFAPLDLAIRRVSKEEEKQAEAKNYLRAHTLSKVREGLEKKLEKLKQSKNSK